MEKNGIWEERWKVAAFMVDTHQQIRLKSIADIFQELANSHANHRKVGFEDMKASGKFWVLNRQAIEIVKWPHWGDQLRVESWISMMKGPFSMRHFAMYDEEDNVIIKASYLWTSIDRVKKRPVAFPPGEFPIVEKRDFELPEPYKLKVEGEIVDEQQYQIRDSDLDIIGHTNNASYLEWAANILIDHNIDFNKLDANYTGESFKNQIMRIRLFRKEPSDIAVAIVNEEDQELFRLKLS